jgi:putative permease
MKDFALKVTVVFAIVTVALVLWQLSSIVGLVLVSLAIAAALRAPIEYLIGRGLSRTYAMLIVYGLGIGAIVALFLMVSIPLSGEFTQLGENLVTAYTRLENGRRVFGRLDALLANRLPTVEQLTAFLTGDQIPVVGQTLLDVAQSVGGVIGQFLLAMVLSIYWTADQVRFERFWLSFVPANQRLHARDVWHSLEAQVGAYLRSEVIQSVLAGLLLVPGFWLLGVQYPVIWALLISVAWLVPLVGGLIFLIPLWLMVWIGANAWLATGAIVYTCGVLALMEFFLQRRLYTQTRYTNVLVILVMLMLVSAYGIVGLLLAPLVATTVEICLTKFTEVNTKAPADRITEVDVSLLRSRLVEVQQTVASLDAPNSLRLANLAERLDKLLKQAEEL